jgi:hypothetical protein
MSVLLNAAYEDVAGKNLEELRNEVENSDAQKHKVNIDIGEDK